jgi:hypothetical protein
MGFYGYHRSSYGAFGGSTIVGDIGFSEQWSYDDWLKSSWNSGYSPISTSVIGKARNNWDALAAAKEGGSPTAGGIIDDLTNQILYNVTNIDQETRTWDYGQGGSHGPTRISAYNKLNSVISKLANLVVADPDAEIAAAQASSDAASALAIKKKADADAAAAGATAATAAALAKKQGTASAIAAAQAAIAAAAQAKAQAGAAAVAHQQAAARSAQTISTLKTPLILAAVAIPVAIIAVMALKKKSPAVAGYRRRRSRR